MFKEAAFVFSEHVSYCTMTRQIAVLRELNSLSPTGRESVVYSMVAGRICLGVDGQK